MFTKLNHVFILHSSYLDNWDAYLQAQFTTTNTHNPTTSTHWTAREFLRLNKLIVIQVSWYSSIQNISVLKTGSQYKSINILYLWGKVTAAIAWNMQPAFVFIIVGSDCITDKDFKAFLVQDTEGVQEEEFFTSPTKIVLFLREKEKKSLFGHHQRWFHISVVIQCKSQHYEYSSLCWIGSWSQHAHSPRWWSQRECSLHAYRPVRAHSQPWRWLLMCEHRPGDWSTYTGAHECTTCNTQDIACVQAVKMSVYYEVCTWQCGISNHIHILLSTTVIEVLVVCIFLSTQHTVILQTLPWCGISKCSQKPFTKDRRVSASEIEPWYD